MEYWGIKFDSEILLVSILAGLWMLPWIILQQVKANVKNKSDTKSGLILVWLISLMTHIGIIRIAYHFKEFPFIKMETFWIGVVILVIQLLPNLLYTSMIKNNIKLRYFFICWLFAIPLSIWLYMIFIIAGSVE